MNFDVVQRYTEDVPSRLLSVDLPEIYTQVRLVPENNSELDRLVLDKAGSS